MKKTNYLLFFSGAGFLLMLGLFLLSNKEATDRINNLEQRLYTLSQTNSVPVPEQADFCGETIALDRLDLRERFDREINTFTYLHATTMLYLKRANRFFPILEPLLKKNGIPDDFKYLCLIESNLDIRALSPANAAGFWQLLEGTGKDYGLEITSEVDERYHIEKATEAACRYFKDAFAKYGNWTNVAVSYNAGMGKISSALSSQKVNSALDLLLVSESSRYLFRILAIKQLFENPYKYGFILKKEDLYPLVPVQRVIVTQTIDDFASFAQGYSLNYMLLKEFNPWLRDTKLTVLPGKTYEIAIPAINDLYFNKNAIKVYDERWLRAE
jgi:hypothetical protein